MEGVRKDFYSSALQVNLIRTAARVDIPEKYSALRMIGKDHFGVSKKIEEVLIEFHHPYVNWDELLKLLKGLSIGDFYVINKHESGLEGLRLLAEIYIDIIKYAPKQDTKETGLRYLFEFLNTAIYSGGVFRKRNISLLPSVLERLDTISDEDTLILKKSSGSIKSLIKLFADDKESTVLSTILSFANRVFKETYRFWLNHSDPEKWSLDENGFSEKEEEAYRTIVEPLSKKHMKTLLEKIGGVKVKTGLDLAQISDIYITLPDYSQIVDGYFIAADRIEKADVFKGKDHILKLEFLFHMIQHPGLSDVYGDILREINRTIGKALAQIDAKDTDDFIRKIFGSLKKGSFKETQTGATIDCIKTIAKEVFEKDNHHLVDVLIEELISFGFQHPNLQGSTTEWQIKANPYHVKNIRAWLAIISMKPRWTKRLLSALIINLNVGGVFVKDTDLLQRDISALLNTDIAPAYNLIKQLLRTLPVYFTEIGAEGELRETSTILDELSNRNDKLIHFLRKQSHVESNSTLVYFLEGILLYYYSGSKEHIKGFLPSEVYEEISEGGEYYDGMRIAVRQILDKVGMNPKNLLDLEKKKIQREISRIEGIKERDKKRAYLLIRLYQLLYKKYHPKHTELLKDMEASGFFNLRKIKSLKGYLRKGEYYRALVLVLSFIERLREKILSPEKTLSYENIYYKRHIATGIPSMYGTYREEKFEALGFSLRLESLANTLFEKLMESLNLKFITKSTLLKIHEYLWLYVKALDLEGISTEGLVAKLNYVTSALQVRQFSIDQYIDIFKFISKGIQDIIHDYYIDVHSTNLPIIIKQTVEKKVSMGKISAKSMDELVYKYSEGFYRSLISSAFGLQILDNLNNSIIKNLSAELEKFKDNKHILNLVMAYIPELAISPIYKINRETDNPILIGNKGYFLKKLAAMSLPVPPGFIITTEVFRGFDAVVGYKYIFKDLSSRIYKEIQELEKTTGLRYGDPKNPLLLSVRSGATISLPGMMRSFLNVGINEEIAHGLGKKKHFEWAAWDSYRRFLQAWAMFHGVDRNTFDTIMERFKEKYGVSRKIEFKPDMMREITVAYRKVIEERGIDLPLDPNKQLEQAILKVFASWFSEQAKTYRRQMQISDEWGTAVIVQKMVFGNLNNRSGSGVIFTRNPKGHTPSVNLYGDFIFGVQGDDIVSGLVETYPITEIQRKEERRTSNISLEKTFPEIYQELLRISEVLIYEKGFNHQEVEFTFENPTKQGLYILQVRDMIQREKKVLRRFKVTKDLNDSLLGMGIGVGGGAISGQAVFSEEDILRFKEKDNQSPLILLRPDTVPDDVGILLKVDGLLTSKGGSTSHAAVTIPQLNKVGVVGFGKLKVYEAKGYATIEGKMIKPGDFISIDGSSGAVYLGKWNYESEEA